MPRCTYSLEDSWVCKVNNIRPLQRIITLKLIRTTCIFKLILMPEGKIIGVAQCVDGARIHCVCFEDIVLPILWLLQYLKKKIIYLAVLGLGCSPWDLRCIIGDLLLWHAGLSNCGTQAQLLHSRWDLTFPVRVWTCVPCTAKQILNHWTTKKVPPSIINSIPGRCWISPYEWLLLA